MKSNIIDETYSFNNEFLKNNNSYEIQKYNDEQDNIKNIMQIHLDKFTSYIHNSISNDFLLKNNIEKEFEKLKSKSIKEFLYNSYKFKKDDNLNLILESLECLENIYPLLANCSNDMLKFSLFEIFFNIEKYSKNSNYTYLLNLLKKYIVKYDYIRDFNKIYNYKAQISKEHDVFNLKMDSDPKYLAIGDKLLDKDNDMLNLNDSTENENSFNINNKNPSNFLTYIPIIFNHNEKSESIHESNNVNLKKDLLLKADNLIFKEYLNK